MAVENEGSERLSHRPPVTAQQGIVNACWQVHVIAPRKWLLFMGIAGGNKDEAVLSRTSWVPADGQAMLLVLNHRI